MEIQQSSIGFLADTAINAACTAFKVSVPQFLSVSRLATLCNARRAACNLMFDAGITNCRTIAICIHRTHATVYHHLATHKNLYLYDHQYHQSYDNAQSIMAANHGKE